MDFPLSMVEVDIMLTDMDYEIGGGLDNRKIPIIEESLMRPTPMF